MLCQNCQEQKKLEESISSGKKRKKPIDRLCLCCNTHLSERVENILFCKTCSEEKQLCEICGKTLSLRDILCQEDFLPFAVDPSIGKQEEKKVISFLLAIKKQGSENHE